ncbi:MAG: hypothetical protein OXF41_20075 [bacterium]|nr:hypothetical protein [bacterium]
MPQSLSHTPRARRRLRGLPRHVRDQIRECIDRYSTDPTSAQVRKLKGADPTLWSLRYGAYRITFDIGTGDIELIGHRRDVYNMIGR